VRLARAYGLEVEVIEAEWGQPLDPGSLPHRLEADTDKRIRA